MRVHEGDDGCDKSQKAVYCYISFTMFRILADERHDSSPDEESAEIEGRYENVHQKEGPQ